MLSWKQNVDVKSFYIFSCIISIFNWSQDPLYSAIYLSNSSPHLWTTTNDPTSWLKTAFARQQNRKWARKGMMHRFFKQSTDPLKEANLTVLLPGLKFFSFSAWCKRPSRIQSWLCSHSLAPLCIAAIPNNLQLMWGSQLKPTTWIHNPTFSSDFWTQTFLTMKTNYFI